MSYERFRFRDMRTTQSFTKLSETYDHGGACDASPLKWRTFGSAVVSTESGTYQTCSDVVVPGFKSRSMRGEVFFNPLSSVSVNIDAGSGSDTSYLQQTAQACSPGPYAFNQRWRYLFQNPGRHFSGFSFNIDANHRITPSSGVISHYDLGNLIVEASTRAQSERGRSKTNLWETLAELNKSATLLTDLARSANVVIHKNRSVFRRARSASDGYLAYRYGLSPVINDIRGVLKGLEQKVGSIRETSRGIATISRSNSSVVSAGHAGADTLYGLLTKTETAEVRAVSLDEVVATLLGNVGFSVKGLTTLPWELVPYSFVCDWFANIGDLIGAIVPTFNARQLGGCYTLQRVIVDDYAITGLTPNAGFTVGGSISGANRMITVIKERTSGLPAPGLVIKADFRLDQLTRAADAFALVAQKLRFV